MGQYDWLFYKYPKEENPADGLLAPVQAYFRGEFSVPGSQVYLPYRAYVKPGIISGEAHFHRDEEYLAIVGHDLRDAFESFDAEVVLYMGESPDAMEKIVIDRPAMLRVPKYYWHGPIAITRLGKPLFFQPVLKAPRYYAMYRRVGQDGRPYYAAVVEGTTPNELDPDKVCINGVSCAGQEVK